MDKIKQNIPIVISLIIAFLFITIIGIITPQDNEIKEVYNVYLDGRLLGTIKSKDALEKYIDNEQKELKEEFNVKKVYKPNGLDIEKCLTHDAKILSEKQIYNKIKEKTSFTIKGYVVTIKSDDKEEKINILDKKMFDNAVNKVLTVFVNKKDVKNYKNDTQTPIETTGSLIEDISIKEKITITESFISTDEMIFDDETLLTKYLLFGSLDKDQEYVVQPGDTIETVSFNNKLGVEEFLIVNPEFTSSTNLLSVGQKVNISLIDPMISIVVQKHVVEDMPKNYETITKDDSSMYQGQTKVQTEGVNGVQRVTSKVRYVNGQAEPAIITNYTTITEPINKVVLKGTKSLPSSSYSGGGSPAVTSGIWGWPTVSPYIVTSEFKYRWGRLHAGIDISGCGFGSPIYSIGPGTVISVTAGCPGQGYLGSGCGGGYGNAVFIDHGNGMVVKYAHLNTVNASVGQRVSRGTYVGTMGNSGSSSGTHLHFEVRVNGQPINPRTLY